MLFGGKRTKLQPDPVYVEWTIEFFDGPGFAGAQLNAMPEDDLRRIVREELAELVPVDVPDAPPKDLR